MKLQRQELLNKLPTLSRYVILAGGVFLLSFLFPDYQQFNYKFEKGGKWQYADLYAPFDFPILKEQTEINKQLDSLKATLEPYYLFDTELGKKQTKRWTVIFQTAVEQNLQNDTFADVSQNPQTYLNQTKYFLQKIYEQGILQIAPKHLENLEEVSVIKGGSIARTNTNSDYFEKTNALEALNDSLRQLNLKEIDFVLDLVQRENLLVPNITYNDSLTVLFHSKTLRDFVKGRGKVKENELIVAQQERITEKILQKLTSLQEEFNRRKEQTALTLTLTRIGYFVLIIFILFTFILFLDQYATGIFDSLQQMLFLLVLILLYSYATHWVTSVKILNIYMVPFCIAPIVIRNFFDNRLAIYTHLTIVLIASLLSSLGYEFLFIQILAGVIVIVTNVKTRYWSKFFISISYIFVTYTLLFVGFSLLQEGNWNALHWQTFGWIFLNAFFTLLSYPLVPLLGRIFGFTSDVTLEELASLDKPLLKKLSMHAPGTFQHSLQVANLSEAAATAIGANALLVKVAALYHDIGKIKNPSYFIENKQNDDPHANLTYLESTRYIIEHVTEGVLLAKKHRLPKIITDFIRTHHGTTRVEYFYRKYKADHPNQTIDETLFRYPGPEPTTKEQAIMMLADSLEAASKSLQNPTEESINELVENITAGKITQNQFIKAPITFEELNIIKNVFKKLLKSIYHVRIEYPKEKN